MPGPILMPAGTPTKLEELVKITVPQLTPAGYLAVTNVLEIQRNYIEAHLKMYSPTHENWHRWVQNLWASLPLRLVQLVNESIQLHRVIVKNPVPLAASTPKIAEEETQEFVDSFKNPPMVDPVLEEDYEEEKVEETQEDTAPPPNFKPIIPTRQPGRPKTKK